jgi:predicted dienelactone hydrolase
VLWAIGEYLVSSSFRAALRDEHHSHRDPRVRAAFAIAPALGPAFAPESLGQISIPVAIVAGRADSIAPVGSNAEYLARHIPHAQLTIYPGGVGHYTFIDTCTENGRKRLPRICNDAPDVDRIAIHEDAARKAIAFFDANLR